MCINWVFQCDFCGNIDQNGVANNFWTRWIHSGPVCDVAAGKRAGFSNSVKNRVLESCSDIFFPLIREKNKATRSANNLIFQPKIKYRKQTILTKASIAWNATSNVWLLTTRIIHVVMLRAKFGRIKISTNLQQRFDKFFVTLITNFAIKLIERDTNFQKKSPTGNTATKRL